MFEQADFLHRTAAPPRRRRLALGLLVAASSISLTQALAAPPSTPQTLKTGATFVATTGGTATSIVQGGNGQSATISTGTVHGQTGLNAFTDFSVGTGFTIKLNVPDAAKNLVNVVQNKVQIDGIVNSYTNGQIGGNVFFVAPGGFVIGQSGTVNVGALTVVAPRDKSFADNIVKLGSDASASDADLTTLLGKDSFAGIPVDPTATILVSGKINAPFGVSLRANSITVDSTGAIKTGSAATGDALFAAAVNETGKAAATAMTTDDKGDIVITASGEATDAQVIDAKASASVDIAGSLNSSGNINLSAAATVAGKVGDSASEGVLKQLGTSKSFPGADSLQGALVRADATSTVHIESGAALTAGGAVTLDANTKADAGVSKKAVGADSVLVVSAIYGEVDAHATAQVDSGAAITTGAGSNLVVNATNAATLDVAATSLTKDTGTASADAVAIGVADVQSKATVAHGAVINAGGVSVGARNDNSFGVDATAYALNDAKAGAALAVSTIDAHADASLAADLGSATTKATGGVTVTALNNTYDNAVSAASSTGNSFGGQVQNIISNPVDAGSAGKAAFSGAEGKGAKVKGFASGLLGKGDGTGAGAGDALSLRASGALALAVDDQSAHASLGDASGAPKIYTDGSVVVAAKSEDMGVRLGSKSQVTSPKPKEATDKNPESQAGVSVALGLGFYDEDTEATVAPGATVVASNIAVDAVTETPITNTFLDIFKWDAKDDTFSGELSGLKDKFADLKAAAKPDLGISKSILTSNVGSSATGSEGSGAGSVSYLDFANTSRAWVGAGASLTTTGALPTTPRTLAQKSDLLAADWTLNLAAPLSVHAFTLAASADVGGPLSLISAPKVFTALDPTDSIAVGGAFTNVASESRTTAGVDAGATLTSSVGVAVGAETQTYHVVLTPVAGAGGAIGLSGMMGRVDVDDATHAIISNTAKVSAPSVALDAYQHDFIINIAADLNKSQEVSVGLAGALNQVSADTQAVIGDTTADRASAVAEESWLDAIAPAATGGYVHTDALTVKGANDGQIIAAAIAGAGTPNKGKNAAGDDAADAPVAWTNNPLFESKTGGDVDPADDKIWHSNPLFKDPAGDAIKKDIQGANKDIDKVLDSAEPASESKNAFQLSGAGSAAVNISTLDTKATVSGASLDRFGAAGAIATTVQTRNDPLLATAAGGGASIGSGSQTPQAAVAGAITVDKSNGSSLASIADGTTIANAGATTVQGLMGGVRVAAALGVALTDPNAEADGGAGAGAFSVVLNKDAAGASISDSTITGSGAASPVAVTAYNATYLGEGGGAGYKGGQGGVGVSFTYADLGDPDGRGATEAKITGSHLYTVGAVSTQAADSSVLVAAAASAGVGASTIGIQGSAADVKLGRTSTAAITGSTIGAAGDVTVSSDGLRQATLDGVLTGQNAPDPSTYSGYDFATGGVTDYVVKDGSRDKLTLATGKGAMAIIAAGAVGVSDKAGSSQAGFAFAGAQLDNTHQATIDSSTVDAGANALRVNASDDTLVVGAAVGVGATAEGPVAGVGSVTYLASTNAANATVTNGSTLTGGAVTIGASDASTIAGLSGSFAKSQSVAVGASATAVTLKNTTSATAADSTIHAGASLDTLATEKGLFVDLAFAGGSSQGVTVGGAVTVNVVQPTTTASLTNVTATPLSGTAANTVTVSATDQASIYAAAVSALFGEDLAAGAAILTNVISDADDDKQRTSALISGGSVDAKDVTVQASSQGSILAAAAGVSVSSDAAVAGSVVTNADDSTTRASIENATVTAQNNVGVIAQSTESANVISGALAFGSEAVGVGLAATTNLMMGNTQAYILGGKVDAQAKDVADVLTVAKGSLTSPPDLGDINDLTQYVLPEIAIDSTAVTGLAVNASSRNKVGMATLGVGVGAGSTGVAVNAGVNVFGGSTKAYVKGAQINQEAADASGAGQMVDIAASDHSYDANLIVSAAGGENVGAAGAFNVNMFSRSTDAHADAGALKSAAATRIDAQSSQTAIGLTVGGGVGEVGGAAAITVTTFDADTTAYATNGATLKAGSLTVDASNRLGTNINDGVVAAGGVAVGGAFSVVTSKNDTFAGLGRSYASDTDGLATVNAGSLSVDAERDADYHLHTVGAAGGGTVGVAGMGSILIAKDTTSAGLYGVKAHGLTDTTDATTVDVQAHEKANADLITGALAIGGSGAGVGGSVGVVVSSTATGAVLEASEVHAADTTVQADSTKNYGSILVSGGVGTAGIGAAVGVVLVGGGQSGGDTGEAPAGQDLFDKAVKTLSAAAGASTPSGNVDSHLNAGETTAAQGAATVSTPTTFAAIDPSAVMAEISGSSIAGGSLTVKALDGTATLQRVGAAGVGAGGAAGGVGYTSVKNTVTASIDPDATISTVNTTVTAAAGNGGTTAPQQNGLTTDDDAWQGRAAEIDTYVGALGGLAGSAGVGVAQVANTVTAQAGGSLNGVGGGALTIGAADHADAKTQNYAVAGGGLAVGAVAGVSTRAGSTTSQILPTTSGAATTVSGYDTVSLSALTDGSVTAQGVAAAGGIVAAGSAVYTLARDTTDVAAILGQANYDAGVGIGATATYTPDAQAGAIGAALGGDAALGAAIAHSRAGGSAQAYVADNARFTGAADLSVDAQMNRYSADASAESSATAGTGSLLVGVTVTDATATTDSHVDAHVGKSVALGSGDLLINAGRDSQTVATSTGVAVGGALAVGVNGSTANVGGEIFAWLDSGFSNSDSAAPNAAVGRLTIRAGSGADTSARDGGVLSGAAPGVDATAVSTTTGAGGIAAGAAATATSDNTTNLYAGITGTDAAQSLSASKGAAIVIDYTTQADGSADATQASIGGKSGASVKRSVEDTFKAEVGRNIALASAGDLTVKAAQTTGGTSQVRAAGGGVATGSAAEDRFSIKPQGEADVGASALLAVLGDPAKDPGALRVQAENLVTGSSSASSTAGALFAGGSADASVDTSLLADTVNIGANSKLASVGQLSVGAFSLQNIDATTYLSVGSFAGSAEGNAETKAATIDTVNIGADTVLKAYGDLSVEAGRSGDGFYDTTLGAHSTSDVYNESLIPAHTKPNATAQNDSKAYLNIASGAQLLGVRDVNLTAFEPANNVSATGTGHIPYTDAVGSSIDGSHPSTSSDAVITMAGAAKAGVLAKQEVDLSASGVLSFGATTDHGLAALGTDNLAGKIQAQIDAITARQASPTLTGDEKASLQTQIDGLTLLLAKMPTGNTPALIVQDMFAAAGDVNVRAKTYNGAGATLEATGGPSITIKSDSPDYQVLTGALTIPVDAASGGHVTFTGGAAKPTSGVTETDPGGAAVVSILSTADTGHASVLLGGDVTNYGGLIKILSQNGDLGQFGGVYGRQLDISVPNGAYVVPASDTFYTGGTPESVYNAYQLLPVGVSGDYLAQAAASAIFLNDWQTNYSRMSFQQYLMTGYAWAGYTGASGRGGGGGTTPTSLTFTRFFDDPGTGGYRLDGENYSGGNYNFPTFSSVGITNTSQVAPSDGGSRVFATSIIANAALIDINGPLIAGHASDWSLNLANNSKLTDLLKSYDYLAGKGMQLGTVSISASTQGLSTSSTSGQQIGLKYDVANKQLVLNAVDASGGGFVYLTGAIGNTSYVADGGTAVGAIKVNNGYGQVSVANDTGVALRVNNINAGQGDVGVVRITDFEKNDAAGNPLTTWWVDKVGEGLKVYDNNNDRTAINLNTAQLINSSSGDIGGYKPADNLRYEWTQEWTATRALNYNNDNAYKSTESNWAVGANPGAAVSKPRYITSDNSTDVFKTSLSATIGTTNDDIIVSCGCRGTYDGATITYVNAQWVSSVDVIETSSVKANNPIQINFTGNRTGLINVASNASVYLAGALTNPNGATTISVTNGGSIIAAGGKVGGNVIDLSATAIGSADKPLGLVTASTADATSAISANATTGVYLNVDGQANLLKVGATAGDVQVAATNGIAAAPNATAIVGDNVTLTTAAGAIGAKDAPILVAASVTGAGKAADVSTANADGTIASSRSTVLHGVLTAAADGDIAITKTAGDLQVGKVASTAGDVYLTADAGGIVNASTVYTIDQATQDRLAAAWSDLHLTDHQAASDAIVHPFEKLIVADYGRYWTIKHNATVTDGVISLTPEQAQRFAGQAAAALNTASPTDEQVRAYVQGQYDEITSLVNAKFGSTAAAGYDAYDPAYSFTLDPTSALYASLTATAGRWTTAQLSTEISLNALTPVTDTQVLKQAPNVIGRNVTLTANTGIGVDLAPATIVLTPGTAASVADRATLAAAGPGDIESLTTDAATGAVTVVVDRRHMLGLDAEGVVTASAGGNLYLGGLNGAALAKLTAGGDTRLFFGGDISNAAASGEAAVTSQNLTLEAGSGDIGAAGKPLTVDLSGVLSSARGRNVSIEALNGDLDIGVAYAREAMRLSAKDGSILSSLPDSAVGGDNDVHLQATSIDLVAKGDIGRDGERLQVKVTDGALTAQGQNLNLYSPTDLTLGRVDLKGDAVIKGGAAVSAADDIDATGFSLSALGQVTFSGKARLETAGDAEITGGGVTLADGSRIRTRSVAGGEPGDLTLTSTGGDIVIGADKGATLTAEGAAVLKSAGDLFAAGRIKAASLDARATGTLTLARNAEFATSGDLHLEGRTFTAGERAAVQAKSGAVSVKAEDALTLGDRVEIQGGGDVALRGASLAFGASDTIKADGDETLAADGLFTIGDGARLIAGSTGAKRLAIKAETLTAGNSLTAAATGDLSVVTGKALTLGDGARLTADGFALKAGGAINLGSGDTLNAGKGAAVLAADGAISAGDGLSLTAAKMLTVTAKGDGVSVGDGATLKAIAATVQAAGDVRFGEGLSGQTPGALTITGGGVSIGSGADLSTESLLTLAAAQGNLTLGAQDSLRGRSVLLSAPGGFYVGDNLRAIAGETLSARSYGEAALGANALLQSLSGDVLLAGGSLTFGRRLNATAAGTLSLASGYGDLRLGDGASLTGGQLTLVSGRSTLVGANAAWASGQDVTLTSAGDARFGEGAAISAARDGLFVTAGLDLPASTLTVGRNLQVDAGGDARLGGALSVAEALRLNVGGALAFDEAATARMASTRSASLTMAPGASLRTQGALQFTTDGDMTIGRLRSDLDQGAAITLTSGGRIASNGEAQANITVASPAAQAQLSARDDIGAPNRPIIVDLARIQAASLQGGVWLSGLLGLTDVSVNAPQGTAGIRTAGGLNFDQITAKAVDIDAAGAVTGGLVKVGSGSIRSRDSVTVQRIETAGPLSLGAPRITAAVANTSATPATLSVTGYGPETNVGVLDLTVNSAVGVTFSKLYVDDGRIATDAATAAVEDGRLGGALSFDTPQMKLLLARAFEKTGGKDLEIVTRTGRYRLSLIGRKVFSTAALFQPDGDGTSISTSTGVLLNRSLGGELDHRPSTGGSYDPVTVSSDNSTPDDASQLEVVAEAGEGRK